MAGDPFLSDPSKKRKRRQDNRSSTTKNIPNRSNRDQRKPRESRDEEIEDEEISSETEDENIMSDDNNEMESDEEFEGENAADKRRRLAKQYLENLRTEELDEFDAKDLDNDNIGRRLQKDVAESKGHIYKLYGDKLSAQIEELKTKVTRIGCKNLTCLSIKYPYLYTVSKDMELIKWDILDKIQRVKHTKGGAKYFNLNNNPQKNHHYDTILCVAASGDGKYVVTGGKDGRLIIWSSESLTCLKVLEARSPINSITFRRNTDQLYAACEDLKVRTYSINQFSQLEILYGHQDNIVDISALSRETCVSVGSRDKTALFWKIADESRLTFRGGDKKDTKYGEGSLDCVSMVDESHFVTGSDNGNVSLWSLAKKKPLYIDRLAHGLEPTLTVTEASGDLKSGEIEIPEPQPFWVTSIYAIPFTDIFVSGSYNGELNFYKIDNEGFRSFKKIGSLPVNGVIVSIECVEVDKTIKGFALVSKEHKLGRWLKVGGRNSLISFAFDI